MIPVLEEDYISDTEVVSQPSYTYEIHLAEDRMGTYIDGLTAMEQAVYHILNTERYKYLIYSWNYGVEFADLFGKPISYCYPEIKRRITEALTQDDRINSVDNFEFTYNRGNVLVSFTVNTTEGEIEIEKAVNIG